MILIVHTKKVNDSLRGDFMDREKEERKNERIYKEEGINKEENYLEEYGAEFVPILSTGMVSPISDASIESSWVDFSIAMVGLFLGAISIFIYPIYLGILGAALAYLAYKKGERFVSPWAFCLGIAGILIGIFLIL